MICGQDASRGAGLNCSQGTSIARNMIGRGGRLDLENRTARLRFGAFEPAMTGRYKQDSERIVAYSSPTRKCRQTVSYSTVNIAGGESLDRVRNANSSLLRRSVHRRDLARFLEQELWVDAGVMPADAEP